MKNELSVEGMNDVGIYYFPQEEVADVGEELESAEMLNSRFSISSEWNYGAFKVKLEQSSDGVSVKAYLLGAEIGSVRLTRRRPCVKVAANLGVWKCSVTICANFATKKVTATGEICHQECQIWPPSCSWSCGTFNNAVIFSW